MPLIHNKHQPFFPDPDSPNNLVCGTERYCHPFQPGDSFSTQFYQTPCNNNQVEDPEFDDYTLGSELTLNGDFIAANLNQWNAGASPLSTTLGVVVNGWTGANPNRVEHISGSTDSLNQSIGISTGYAYQINIKFTRTSGSIQVALGDGIDKNVSASLEVGGTYDFPIMFTDSDLMVQIIPTTDFVGYIEEISVKEIAYNLWQPNGSWLLDNGIACHIQGQVGDLKDTNANYIDAGGYYVGSVTLSGYVQGYVEMWLSDVLAGTMNANGTYTFYDFPTASGTIKFIPSIDFIGCLSNPSSYELRNDYSGDIIDSDGNEFDVSNYFSYFNEFVTLDFDFSTVGNYELPTGCYSVKVYDQCAIESDNLVFNGDFALGYTDWSRNNGASQYSIVSDELQFIFSPFTQGYTSYITNGDFSSGSAWTLNAGWTILGGKAVHTPGNTGTLFQTMTLPTPPPLQNYSYWAKFTVSNWTTGTINIKLGNAVNGTTYTWKGNDTFVQFYQPRQSGSVDIIFTPSSTFDGEIDNVDVVLTSGHVAFPIITNANQPLFTIGTYQTEWEIVGVSDPNISVRFYLQGGVPTPPYQSDIGVQSYTQTYNLNGGNVVGVANFGKTSIDYIQTNYVIGDITVDNINVVKTEPFEATYQTECLSYNENGWDKTKMLVGWCDQNAFGFEFVNTGFKLRQRALVRSISANYPKEKTIQKMGNGNARVVYSEVEKYWELHTDFASETFHDCVAIQIDCDHFGIGDTQGDIKEYIAESEGYQPNWNGDGAYSLATAIINLRIKDKGQIFNRHL
jgi:hypothetical protein